MMTDKYQIYGVDSDGRVNHAGVHKFAHLTDEAIREFQAKWEEWARDYVATHPGNYPLRHSIGKTVKVIVHPIDEPNRRREIVINTGSEPMPRKKKTAAPAVDDTFVAVSPITYSYCQEAPLYELAANAVNLLCAIANRRGHRIGQDPESCIERAISAAAEVAVLVGKGGG